MSIQPRKQEKTQWENPPLNMENKILEILSSIVIHHMINNPQQWFVLSLSNTILPWCVRDWMLHLNTCIFTILNELRLNILTTIVRSKDLESPPRLVFNQGLKDFEEVKKFRLMLQEVNLAIPGKFIYEGQWIFGLTHGHMRKWTSNITVDQLKRCRGSLMTSSLKFVL